MNGNGLDKGLPLAFCESLFTTKVQLCSRQLLTSAYYMIVSKINLLLGNAHQMLHRLMYTDVRIHTWLHAAVSSE